MINITLPDGTQKQYEQPYNGLKIAVSIGKKLARDAIAIKVNGIIQDLQIAIKEDSKIEIITKKSPEGIDIIRHDAAHVMAEAVQSLFKNTQVAIGPTIENGFYYDFDFEKSFSTDDFEKIEKKMLEIIREDKKFVREVWSKNGQLNISIKKMKNIRLN